MKRTVPRLVVAIPFTAPAAALFALYARYLVVAGLDLDNHTVPFVAELRVVVSLAVWATLVYWAAWETDSIRRAVSRTFWAFTVASLLIPIAAVWWGATLPPHTTGDAIIIPPSFIVLVVVVAGVLLGLVGLLLAKTMSPSAAPERRVGWLLGDTRETVRRIGDARVATGLALLAVGVVGLHVGEAEGSWSEKYTAIATAYTQTCGVRTDGTAHCWGANRAIPPEDERITSIAVGSGFACGLREDGSAVCWGNIKNSRGLDVPADPGSWTGSEQAPEIYTGFGYVCKDFLSGRIECSQDGEHGEFSPLNGESFIASSSGLIYPSSETSRGPFKQIAAGGNHVCGLYMDGSVVCWGGNESGEASPPKGEAFTAIRASTSNTCGLRPDEIWDCWGSVRPPRAGNVYRCHLLENGTASCWGGDEPDRRYR